MASQRVVRNPDDKFQSFIFRPQFVGLFFERWSSITVRIAAVIPYYRSDMGGLPGYDTGSPHTAFAYNIDGFSQP